MRSNFASLPFVSGCGLQAFREEVAPLRQDVRVVNELSAELTPLDIQLSSTASRQLDQLNMRWKLLQVLLKHRPDVSHWFSFPTRFIIPPRWRPKFPTLFPPSSPFPLSLRPAVAPIQYPVFFFLTLSSSKFQPSHVGLISFCSVAVGVMSTVD